MLRNKCGSEITKEEKDTDIGEWAWQKHPGIFQYSKTYIRLSSTSTERRSTGSVVVEREDEAEDVENDDETDEEDCDDL